MWKILVVLLLTALAIAARLAYDAPAMQTRVGALISEMQGGATAPLAPSLMYAGVRG
jgi:hypothetical protein